MQPQPTQNELIAGLKRSATIIQNLQNELQGYHEPIAVIGMGCRFPGDVNTPTDYWEMLRAGISAIADSALQRWQNIPNSQHTASLHKATQQRAHFLKEVIGFDAQFFGISPREATWLDPQHRLLLEVSVEALEHANLPLEELQGSRTGVYMGQMNQDYIYLLKRDYNLDTYAATGTEASFASGRLSYSFGLRGPSLSVGTACSSTLVTAHLACQALRSKECDIALSGGVSLMLDPYTNELLDKMQATSDDGLSKTFDAAADGYGRGEGCGVLVLKRLADAQRDGDTIWALIRGSAVNHDGRSGGLTVPSGPAQEELLQQALSSANIDAHAISYVEAHGTGTSLGDPIEMRALGNVLCINRPTPLLIGSVKTNIGHLEAAAGVAGIIKVILAMQHKQIPPHLHFRNPNPNIPWAQYDLQIPTSLTEWQSATPRIAGVSSYGLSGINAHVILEEFAAAQEPHTQTTRPCHLLTLSAKTSEALHDLAQRYQVVLTAQPKRNLADLCYSAYIGRSHYPHRLSVVAADNEELGGKLADWLKQEIPPGVTSNRTDEQLKKIAFLFTGQGAQSRDMGRQLYETQPLFRQTMERCDEILRPLLGRSILQIIFAEKKEGEPDTNLIDQTTYTQPALFALEYALATLWQSWGVQPTALIGHSVGEVVAACVAGVFSLEDGLKLIAARGRLMGDLPQDGEMLSLLADEATASRMIAPYPDEVAIAAVNGPESVVISGKRTAVLAIAEQLTSAGIKHRKLTVSHAFHSPLMEPMLEAFRQVAARITYHKPNMRLISNLTGSWAGDEVLTPDYWVRHVRQAVRFADGIQTLHAQGISTFLEIGPKPVLVGMAQQMQEPGRQESKGKSSSTLFLPSLREGHSDWRQMLSALGALYVHGLKINWQGVEQGEKRHKVILPTYPFQHQNYWVDKSFRRKMMGTLGPLIDKKITLPRQKQTVFEKSFSSTAIPFLTDHQVYEEVVVPAAGYLSLGLSAAQTLFEGNCCQLQDVVFSQALTLAPEQTRTVQLLSERQGPGAETQATHFQIISFEEQEAEEPLLHASGQIRRGTTPPPIVALSELQAQCKTGIPTEQLYATLAQKQIQLGPTFRWLQSLWVGAGEALAQLQLPDSVQQVADYVLFPGLVDACFQVVGAALLERNQPESAQDTLLPFALESMQFYAPTNHQGLWCHAQQIEENKWNILLLGESGEVIAQITGFQLRAVPASAIQSRRLRSDWLYTLDWQPRPLPEVTQEIVAEQKPDCWLLFGDQTAVSTALSQQLAAQGTATILATTDSVSRLPADCASGEVACATLDPTNPAMFGELIAHLAARYTSVGIGYLWGIAPATCVDELPDQAIRLNAGLLHLAQALVPATLRAQLWVVTQGCHVASGLTPASVTKDFALGSFDQGSAAGTLWGMGRTIAKEQPQLHCKLLDLGESNEVVEIIQNELLAVHSSDQIDDQIWYKGNLRHTAHLVRWQKAQATSDKTKLPVAERGSYLITGGLGALGLLVAQQLVADGAKYLILSGRQGVTNIEQRRILDELTQAGADVRVLPADIADRCAVENLIDRCQTVAPLRGIVHVAGIVDDGVLTEQSLARLAGVMRPKVHGTWHLHTLSSGLDLDFFVCFSSAASLLGSPGQSNYAAANAFMDTLMQQRRQQGLPGLSINWGAWSEVGLAAHLQTQMQRQSMGMIAPEQGKLLFHFLYSQSIAQIGVLPFQREHADEKNPVQPTFDRQVYQSMTSADRKTTITALLRQGFAAIGGYNDAQLDEQRSLLELGLDSLMAVQLRNYLMQALSLTIPVTLLLEGASLASLADYVTEHLAESSPEHLVASDPYPASAPIASIDHHQNGAMPESPTHSIHSIYEKMGGEL